MSVVPHTEFGVQAAVLNQEVQATVSQKSACAQASPSQCSVQVQTKVPCKNARIQVRPKVCSVGKCYAANNSSYNFALLFKGIQTEDFSAMVDIGIQCNLSCHPLSTSKPIHDDLRSMSSYSESDTEMSADELANVSQETSTSQ